MEECRNGFSCTWEMGCWPWKIFQIHMRWWCIEKHAKVLLESAVHFTDPFHKWLLIKNSVVVGIAIFWLTRSVS